MPAVIHADDVKHLLRDVDAEYAHVLCDGTCLLSVHGCRRCRNHSGVSKPYWKEAGPFHSQVKQRTRAHFVCADQQRAVLVVLREA